MFVSTPPNSPTSLYFYEEKRSAANRGSGGELKGGCRSFFMQKNGMEPIQQCKCILQSIQCEICMNVDIQ